MRIGRYARAVALVAWSCAGAPRPPVESCPAWTPSELAPAANQDLSLVLEGRGVQHYECTGTTVFEWTLVAPKAELYAGRKLAGTHTYGPTWTHADGSSVVGTKRAQVTVDPTAVPWVLLDATSHGAVPGAFADVTAIQRLATTGGMPPKIPCDAVHVGAKSDAPYTARYVFYRTSERPTGRCAAAQPTRAGR